MEIIECKNAERSTHMKFGGLYILAVRKEKQPIVPIVGKLVIQK